MSYIQSAKRSGSGSTITIPFVSPNTQGNALIGVVLGNGSSGFSDSNNNLWSPVLSNFVFKSSISDSTVSLYVAPNCKAGSNTVTSLNSGGTFANIVSEYSNISFLDGQNNSSFGYAPPGQSGTSGNVNTRYPDTAIEIFAAVGGGGLSSTTDGSVIRSQVLLLALADRQLSTPGVYAATGTFNSGSPLFFGMFAFSSTLATPGSILGTFSGSSLQNAFSSNPLGLDIIQVISEGGTIVWNLTASGVSNFNPSNPTMQGSTPQALLQQFYGSSLAVAVGPNNTQDIIQVVGPGQAMNFRVDYLGNAHSA